MIYPESLIKGDSIGVTATSAGTSQELDIIRLENAKKHFADIGYPVIETPNVRRNEKGRSSSGPIRAKEFMKLIEDPQIKAIIAAGGGDFLVEMLPYLDFNKIKENTKWFQGYSDNTGLTFTITTNLDIATIYSNNFGSFGMANWHKSLEANIAILEGNNILQDSFEKYQDGFLEKVTGLEEFLLNQEVKWKNCYPISSDHEPEELSFKGRAIGGCLDVLLNLVGTRFDKTKEFIRKYKQDGILWFLESFDLSGEAMVRGLWQLKEAGWFENSIGFIFGRPAMYRSDNDLTYEEAVLSVLGELNLPIILEADIGHKPPQFTMMNGAIATINSKAGKGNIYFERR